MTSLLGTTTRLVAAFAATTALSGLGAGAAHAAATPTCFDHRATIVGTAGDDTINGTAKADVIVGLGGNDKINGLDGNDLICGGDGADTLYGGAGDDQIKDGRGAIEMFRGPELVNDVVIGGPGDDRIVPVVDDRKVTTHNGVPDLFTYQSATGPVHVDAATGVVDATQGGQGTDHVVVGTVGFYGSTYADTMVGGPGNDFLNGLGGADRIEGGAGDDKLFDDRISATSADADVLSGGSGDDYLTSDEGDDTLSGDAGDDSLDDEGETSADVITGGDGDDTISTLLTANVPETVDGGAGRDDATVFGRPAGTRPITVDLQAGTLVVGNGAHQAHGRMSGLENLRIDALGRVTISGTDADERLDASGSPGEVHGRGGDDWVVGGDAGDLLDGGLGTDLAWPGGGTDTCVSVERTRSDDRCEINQ